MDKETLSNYGWIIICLIVVGMMIALAGPLGTYIQQSTQNSVTNFGNKAAEAVKNTVAPISTVIPA